MAWVTVSICWAMTSSSGLLRERVGMAWKKATTPSKMLQQKAVQIMRVCPASGTNQAGRGSGTQHLHLNHESNCAVIISSPDPRSSVACLISLALHELPCGRRLSQEGSLALFRAWMRLNSSKQAQAPAWPKHFASFRGDRSVTW